MTRARARVLMIQGTASHVGKSVLVAALCRLFAREGLRVAPFKAQNISLNAVVTPGGGEIGVAQAVQALAACRAPSVEMNPVLVKPEPGGRAQVVLLGRVAGIGRPGAGSRPRRAEIWRAITRSLDALRAECDLVVIEGAGSPAEINLRRWDLANMRVARYARAPVLLVGDIDRGGVFASLAGTMALLREEERALVRGLVINKFRGDPDGLRPGIAAIEARTHRPVLGVLPYVPEYRLPEEDAVALEVRPEHPGAPADGSAVPQGRSRLPSRRRGGGWLDVAIVHLPYISNFDEFAPLERAPGVRVRYVRPGQALGHPDLVILPGSKSTVADLAVLLASGLGEQVRSQAASGVPVLGVCGGYQMLGERILDPRGVESPVLEAAGLGLLRAVTTFGPSKRTARVRARVAMFPWSDALSSLSLEGYQIHMGRTVGEGPAFLRIVRRDGAPCDEPDGTVSPAGPVLGTSVHGLFSNEAFRRALLGALWARRGGRPPVASPPATLDEVLDGLAGVVARHLATDRLRRIIGLS
jgi:adenosylcobyric acid synthase